MMDAILNAAPSLVARAAPKLLPAFLDQISIRKNSVAPERALSVNLQSSNTSTRWRIKVLGRLHALLMASSELTFKTEVTNRPQGLRLVNYDKLCIPIIPYSWDEPCVIQGLFSTGAAALVEQELFSDSKQMKSYIVVLMPLLFETWVEVGPSAKLQKETGMTLRHLQLEKN
jgi:pre-rRNA-processing protein IPI1